MPFVKLDCGLLDSTLWMDRPARDVFLTALMMAEPYEITEPTPELEIRRVNETSFVVPPGWYVYAGNARGRGGIRGRVKRHLRRGKPPHWHVDRLTEAAETMVAIAFAGGDECMLVQALLARPRFHAPVAGFGSTDCRVCPAHLLTVGT